MDPTHRLPDEIMSQVFALSDTSDGFAYSPTLSVSRRWREIALDCPLYWRHINFHGTGGDPSDIQAALVVKRRIEQAGARPISVSIDIDSQLRSGLLADNLLPLIAAHLTHIKDLSITGLKQTQIHLVLAALARPAPMLVSFALRFIPTEHGIFAISPVLLKRLFAASAPRLVELTLGDAVVVGASGMWPLGRQIRTLYLAAGVQPPRQTPYSWQTAFPNVEVLKFDQIKTANSFVELRPGHHLRQVHFLEGDLSNGRRGIAGFGDVPLVFIPAL